MNIKRALLLTAVIITVGSLTGANAQTFTMTGGAAAAISVGDTLVVPDDEDVSIRIEPNSRLLVKGGSSITLTGGDGAVGVALDDGQVFLDRNAPHQLSSIDISTKGLTFTPAGTAAAVKTTPQGAPTVAVLRGSMRMTNAQGETVAVGPRQFGTVNSSGGLVSGELNDRGLAQLESWSGVKAEPAPEAVEPEDEPASASASTETPASASTQPSPPPPASAMPAPAPSTGLPAAAELAESVPDDGKYQPEDPSAKAAPDDDDDRKKSRDAGPTPIFSKPGFELSAGVATVNNEPWTRLALGIDLPIWKFGVFLDLELFIDPESKVSNKGWDFKDNAADAIFRKIRYVRFGYEEDPLFIKFGGLSNVTLGYGIIMDRFTNMLHYPDQKLLGLQFYLNDITPMGVSLQTVISDFAEMKDDGGVYAARLAFRPLKTTGIPIISGLTLGGTYAYDRNTHAPARFWTVSGDDAILKEIRDEHPDFLEIYKDIYERHTGRDPDERLDRIDAEEEIMNSERSFGVWGADVGLPLINTKLLNVTLYGQYASRADSVHGWGLGAPGVSVKVWRLWAGAEYRMIRGRYTPGFFDTYYLDERLSRNELLDKSQYIPDVSLNGVFGRAGMDVFGILTADASMQYMFGDDEGDRITDRRYEVTLGIGETIMQHIPMIDRAEVYVRNSNIGMPGNFKFDSESDTVIAGRLAGFFDRTPYMYWGYRTGFQITKGASLVWDYRYGWKIANGRLVPDNRMFLQTALRF